MRRKSFGELRTMGEIPAFDEAVQAFRNFLQREGHPTTVVWVFRDDLWQISLSHVLVRQFRGEGSVELAEKVFREGKAKGLVELRAIARTAGWTVATVWYPKHDEDEVQGWSERLKLAITQPLPAASRVPSVLWESLSLLPGFRRYQRNAIDIGTRHWAAA